MEKIIKRKAVDLLPNSVNSVNGINLIELLDILWKEKKLIFAITFIFGVTSIATALYLPNIYRSEATLAPAEETQGGGLAALAGQFGGLASLAGVNLGNGTTDKAEIAISIMNSRKFISTFIESHKILADLLAVDYWDRKNNKIIYDKTVYNQDVNKWVRDVKLPRTKKPSMQEAYRAFIKIMEISQDKRSGLVTIYIKHKSPYIAKKWVTWLIEDINLTMKERDVVEAVRSKKYLEMQIEKTNLADIKSVLYSLIEEQEKTIMFSNVRTEYIFKTIDPAIVPEEKYSPKRSLICLAITFMGMLLSLFISYIKHSLKQDGEYING